MEGSHSIQAVRRGIDEELGERVVRFWVDNGALAEPTARARLADLVCVLLDSAGEVKGVNSVYEDHVGLIGNRTFWIYRTFLAPDTDLELARPMIAAAREALEDEFQERGGGPIGLCVLVTDPEVIRRYPEAVWPDSEMLYAGYTREGAQVRVGYFEGAVI